VRIATSDAPTWSEPDQSVSILPSCLKIGPITPDSTTLITYAMTVAAQVRWQNQLMAQTRWQWLRFIGTGQQDSNPSTRVTPAYIRPVMSV
jgi:hypothetical protein